MSMIQKENVEQWRELAKRAPDPVSEHSRGALPMAGSVRVASRPDGLDVRFKCSEGRHYDLALNPVVAQTLVYEILQSGLEGGWLDEDYNLKVQL